MSVGFKGGANLLKGRMITISLDIRILEKWIRNLVNLVKGRIKK